MLSILFFTFVGYFFAVYRENANQALNCSLLIIAASCLYSENPIFGGKQPENRALRLVLLDVVPLDARCWHTSTALY